MGPAPLTRLKPLKHIEWMWQSNTNPWSNSEPAEWSHYSDVENLIIEEAFSNNQPKAMFDRYYIDFEHKIQILNDDHHKQRPVKRVECNKEDKHLREERFMVAPMTSKRSTGGEYGWVSPFIIEVRRDLGLKKDQLASKDKDLIPMLVEKAALGIIEEGTQIGRRYEAEKLANLLREQKDKGFKEVWKRCAYLYSLESFLYKTLNATMRLIGTKEHEQNWRSKIPTLGPFCLLLWDDPINKKAKTDTTLYRGANLKPEDIAMYEDMAKHPNKYRSFQAFTSCSRNRAKVENFGNTVFILKVLFAFVADISSLSHYKEEEEELVTPGVCYCVQDVKFDSKTNKHLITLQLKQRWSSKHEQRFLDHFGTILSVFLNILSLTCHLI
jgi:hypothetical protein